MPEAPAPPVAPPAAPPASKARVLLSRTISTVCLVGILCGAFWFSQTWLFALLFAILSMGALIEYFRLFPIRGFRRFRWQTYGVSVAYMGFLFSNLWNFEAAWLTEVDGLAVALLVTLVVLERLRYPLEGFRTLDEIAATIFGFIYCVLLFSFVPKILMLPLNDTAGQPSAPFYLIYLLTVTKLTDMGAYLVGSLIGRDKMIPHVSPGKTWQGFGGAIIFAVIGSFGLYFIMGQKIPLITPLHAGILAVLLALVAVLGDLAESILKRSLEAKDSGHVMPGIGGFLDLIDSVIFTAPLFYIYLLIFS
jgi:phosphatidate cytidylyltransferase